jgi:hypothetical protein
MSESGAPSPAYSGPAPHAPLVLSLDAARERAIRLLTDGFAYDLISVDEFEWRLGQLGRCDSAAAMNALVADLTTPSRELAGQGTAGSVPPSEGRIVGFMSETRRVGPWHVPQHLRVRAFMSEVKIDLRYALIPPACMIDLAAVMANVKIIVAPGTVVDFEVGAFMAKASNDERAVSTDVHALPHLRIRGSAVMAEVRVRVRDRGR